MTAASPCIGMVAPYDFARDRELWRWLPDPLDLLLTRTPYEPLPVTVEMAQRVGDPAVVAEATLAVATPGPAVVGYACTSGSFVGGVAGERALVDAMLATGVPAAVTASGAVVAALRALGVGRVAVATPYDEAITALLVAYLEEAGIAVTGTEQLGLHSGIWAVPREVTTDLVRHAWTTDCEAVFVSCTNLATYDVITPLEHELGVPVVSANQATMWAAVSLAGLTAQGEGQRLLQEELPA
jgi:maleate isomerase